MKLEHFQEGIIREIHSYTSITYFHPFWYPQELNLAHNWVVVIACLHILLFYFYSYNLYFYYITHFILYFSIFLIVKLVIINNKF